MNEIELQKMRDIASEKQLPLLVVTDLENYCTKKNLNEETKIKMYDRIVIKYRKALVENGEAVGIIAAQSLGEPGTQLTFRTKHFAGAREVSVGSGIHRVEEIVDGRSKAKYPTMTIYAKPELANDREKLSIFAKSLVNVKMDDIIKITEDFTNKTITVNLKADELKERNVDGKEVIEKITSNLKAKTKVKGSEIEVDFKKYGLLKIRRIVNKIKNTRFQGVKGIEKIIIVREGEEFVIKTKGSNLKAILKVEGVDEQRTTTNDIKEISKVLGIEACRQTIVNELYDTLVVKNDIKVDTRHFTVLADTMTFDGELRGVVRTGITGEKASPFARAAFEQTIKHLLEASFRGEKDFLQGVVENIIVGQPIKIGTGTVELVIDYEKKK